MPAGVERDAAHVLLADGTVALIRPARPDDAPAVLAMHEAMSPENRRMRFLAPSATAADRFAQRVCEQPQGPDHGALLAVLDGEIVGVAGYDATDDPATAEVALSVADHAHGRGIGTLLLEHMASLAREYGITAFHADVLSSNHEMLRVFADAGMRTRRRFDSGVVEVTLPLERDDRYLDAVTERAERAERESIDRLLRPTSTVVIGGTRREVSVGNAVLRNIHGSGYTGRVYTVHPQAERVAGTVAHHSVAELPETPDLAVVAVPPHAVTEVARECGSRGVRALVVITAGLDARDGRELLAVCREHGMRLVGPNCFGVANLSERTLLHATFAARAPTPGSAGIVVQSGGVGIMLLEHLSRLGIGVSSFLSVGNRLDVSSNDMLAWWEAESATTMVVVHVESFGNPRTFSRIARRLGREKPILTVRAGHSPAGRRAAASHTGAAVTPALTTDALLTQAGIIATSGIGELIDTAAVLAHQPLPAGPGVAVVTNAGGIGVLAADACVDAGLEINELSPETRADLAGLLPAGAAHANPVDTTPAARDDRLRACVRRLAAAPEVDAIVVVMVRTALADPRPAVTEAARDVPLVAVTPDQEAAVTTLPAGDHTVVPSYSDPQRAAMALGNAWRRAGWLTRPAGAVPQPPGVAAERARGIARDFLARSPQGGWLPMHRVMELLECYGIEVAPWRRADDAEAVVRAVAEIGGPVAVKADAEGAVHKRRSGALRLDLSEERSVRRAYAELSERFSGRLRGILVQAMAPRGFEVLFGIAQQPVFGPLLVCGPGGTYTDALRGRAARLVPLTDIDAAELVRSVPALRELGERDDEDAVDLAALEGMALRLSSLSDHVPEVAELDMNPVLARRSGAVCVDARARLTPRPHGDPELRALRPL